MTSGVTRIFNAMVHEEVVNYNDGLILSIVELWACNLVMHMTSLTVIMVVAVIKI